MKEDDIPQDASKLEDKNIRELYYVLDKEGKYTTGLSTGWEAKSIALDLTIDLFNQQLEEARQEVLNGEKSPIYYFMLKEKMDVGILAGYVGKFQWTVKRHFKPTVFQKLSTKVLQEYAAVFEIEIQQLTDFNE